MSVTHLFQKALYAALAGDAQLAAVAGTGRVFDDAPPGLRPPYLLLSDMEVADWSTGSETGVEIAFNIHVWSDRKGRRQAAQIADAARLAALSTGNLDPPHTLVNLRHVATRFERDPQTEYHHAVLGFRAVVEPA
jgi:purine nucleoside permease